MAALSVYHMLYLILTICNLVISHFGLDGVSPSVFRCTSMSCECNEVPKCNGNAG